MSKEEIEEWLAHIPIFAVTDSNGAGVVLRPDNDTSVFYFFMSPQMANATLETLKGTNENMDLRVSAFSLGKIWFKILNSESDTEVMVRTYIRTYPIIIIFFGGFMICDLGVFGSIQIYPNTSIILIVTIIPYIYIYSFMYCLLIMVCDFVFFFLKHLLVGWLVG